MIKKNLELAIVESWKNIKITMLFITLLAVGIALIIGSVIVAVTLPLLAAMALIILGIISGGTCIAAFFILGKIIYGWEYN
jgi:hypothetical protein